MNEILFKFGVTLFKKIRRHFSDLVRGHTMCDSTLPTKSESTRCMACYYVARNVCEHVLSDIVGEIQITAIMTSPPHQRSKVETFIDELGIYTSRIEPTLAFEFEHHSPMPANVNFKYECQAPRKKPFRSFTQDGMCYRGKSRVRKKYSQLRFAHQIKRRSRTERSPS